MRHTYSIVSAMALLTATAALGQNVGNVPAMKLTPTAERSAVKQKTTPRDVTKAGGTILFYEDFQNGLAGNNAYGAWTTAGQDSLVWTHDFDGSAGQYWNARDPLASLTAANGWMIFDADSSNPGPPSGFQNREGYLVSPVIDLTGYPNVHMEFQQNFRFCCSYLFRLRVGVSTDNFASVTEYVVNEPYLRNQDCPNPFNMRFSITSALIGGDLTNVQFRFQWEGLDLDPNSQGTSHYYWMVDDVTLVESPADDMVITKAEYSDFAGTGELEYAVYSYDQVRPITFKGWILNDGVNPQTNVTMNMDVVGNTPFSGTSASVDVQPLQRDSLIATTTFTPPAATDDYTVNYSLSQDQVDINPLNNDTVRSFSVDEYIFARDRGVYQRSFNNGDPADAFELCNLFDITATTTLYSIDVVLTPRTNMDVIIDGTLYDGNLDYVDETNLEHQVTAADTTSFGEPGNYVRLFFQVPPTLTAGETYAACIRHFGGDSLVVAVSGNTPDQTAFIYDTPTATWFFTNDMPMVRMNFNPNGIGIAENAGNIAGLSARPNPFNTTTTIGFTLLDREDVTFTLTDVAGRTVRTERLGNLAAGAQRIEIDGATMDAGVYFFTLRTKDAAVTERIVLQR